MLQFPSLAEPVISVSKILLIKKQYLKKHKILRMSAYTRKKKGKRHLTFISLKQEGDSQSSLRTAIPPVPDPEVLSQKVESPQSLLFCKPHDLLEVCQSMLSDELKGATMVNLGKKRSVDAFI